MSEKLQKVLATAGLRSRRALQKWISAGSLPFLVRLGYCLGGPPPCLPACLRPLVGLVSLLVVGAGAHWGAGA